MCILSIFICTNKDVQWFTLQSNLYIIKHKVKYKNILKYTRFIRLNIELNKNKNKKTFTFTWWTTFNHYQLITFIIFKSYYVNKIKMFTFKLPRQNTIFWIKAYVAVVLHRSGWPILKLYLYSYNCSTNIELITSIKFRYYFCLAFFNDPSKDALKKSCIYLSYGNIWTRSDFISEFWQSD